MIVSQTSMIFPFQIPEASLYAKMDFECRIRGAEFLAYPPVVAGKRIQTAASS